MIGALRVIFVGVAKGIVGILGTIRSVSTAPTNAGATNFSNQKHLAVLSSGREVMVIGDTTSTTTIWYSDDDWATKTEFAGDNIGGWSNGSIDVYTDSGGTQRLVVAWKQSGTSGTGPTGGARTNGYPYFAVGTFNAGATTITWGAALLGSSLNSTNNNYPDLIAIPYSTGGKVLFVLSSTNGVNANVMTWGSLTADSSGVLSDDGNTANSSNYGLGVPTYPSCCVDPATSRVFAAWSAGTTGAGNGVRFKTWSFSAGTWTGATELEVNNTRYINDSTRYLVCRWWAGTSTVIIGGFLYNGSTNDLMQYELVSPFTSVGTTRTLSAAVAAGNSVFEGGMAVFAGTGDVFYSGRNGAQSDVAYYWWTRGNTTLGSRTVIQSANVTSPFVYVWPRTYKIGFMWTALNSSPYTVKAVALT